MRIIYQTYLSYVKMGLFGVVTVLVGAALYRVISDYSFAQITASAIMTGVIMANALVGVSALLKRRRRLASHTSIAGALSWLTAFFAIVYQYTNDLLPDNQRVPVRSERDTGRLHHAFRT